MMFQACNAFRNTNRRLENREPKIVLVSIERHSPIFPNVPAIGDMSKDARNIETGFPAKVAHLSPLRLAFETPPPLSTPRSSILPHPRRHHPPHTPPTHTALRPRVTTGKPTPKSPLNPAPNTPSQFAKLTPAQTDNQLANPTPDAADDASTATSTPAQ